jgi:TatD DNase family protein
MRLVDTHCHIHFDSYGLDIGRVLKDAAQAGVTKMICVGCSLADSQLAVNMAAKYENIWASVGAHPHDGEDFLSDPEAHKKFKDLINKPKVVAIGEIGLDYFHENSSKADQAKALREQIELGMPSGKPFIFHVREAFEDFWPIFDSYPGLKGVVHSFSTNVSHLDEILSRGLCVGLNGIMTFTKDETQLEAAKRVPLDKLLLETDAPFLTPKPYRGQKCEPKHVRNIAEFLAELRKESLEEIARATTQNAQALFGISK